MKVRILQFLTTFTQLNARLKNFLRCWLLVLGLQECLVECETLCVKSEVILLYIISVNFDGGLSRALGSKKYVHAVMRVLLLLVDLVNYSKLVRQALLNGQIYLCAHILITQHGSFNLPFILITTEGKF